MQPDNPPPSYPTPANSTFTDYAQKSAGDVKHSHGPQPGYVTQDYTGSSYQPTQYHATPAAGGSGTLGPAVPPPPQQPVAAQGQYPAPTGYPQQHYNTGPQQAWAGQPQVQYSGQPIVQPGQQPYIIAPPTVAIVSGGPSAHFCPPGQHIWRTEFGACGIIAAILLFPIGLLFLLVDQHKKCIRCGALG